MRNLVVALVSASLVAVLAPACTETPSYFPPCVDPYTPCVYDAGADVDAAGLDSASAVDAADGAPLESGD